MEKIIIIQSIFIYDLNQEERWKSSLVSLNIFLEKNEHTTSETQILSEYDIEIYIIGYAQRELNKNIVDSFENIKKYLKLLLFIDKNYGKSYNVNKILDNQDIKGDFLFYLDGDIILPENEGGFKRLIKIYNSKPLSISNYGIIALNQKEDCRHNPLIYLRQFNIVGEELLYSDSEYGIAGGVYFMNYNLAKQYRLQDVGIYGPDDTLLIKTLRDSGYISVVVKSFWVTHPYEKDKNYKKNKIEIISGSITNFFLKNRLIL